MSKIHPRCLSFIRCLKALEKPKADIRMIMEDRSFAKRIKLDPEVPDPTTLRAKRAGFLDSLSRAVSPPRHQPATEITSSEHTRRRRDRNELQPATEISSPPRKTPDAAKIERLTKSKVDATKRVSTPETKVISSPIQLTKVQDLSPAQNIDAISLSDILGDPLIREAWIFNFCFDVDWLMEQLDPDVRDSVQVKIVHGSWRNGDTNKLGIDSVCRQRPNVQAFQAYLPDAFGTHHSKMFILFRHDDHAQVIILTANMLRQDWTNMTQAVWKSPLLPLFDNKKRQPADQSTGVGFKDDLLRYLGAYGSKLKPLVQQLRSYDFGEVKAILVASVPSKFEVSAPDDKVWGHEMLRRKLLTVSYANTEPANVPHFVFQISSIASLPASWLEETLYSASKSSKQSTSIIFPTASDVAMSLDGYLAGGSIHTKAQSAVHMKQISSLRPQLCRWTLGNVTTGQAGRGLAAPHIKTYIRFASKPSRENPTPEIEWALITSANLSTQAWGSAPKLAKGEKDLKKAVIHVQSYEIGVLVWPGLYISASDQQEMTTSHSSIKMLPSFKKDTPNVVKPVSSQVIGFRMPYDLPLTPYSADELPWSAQSSYDEPDRHGRLWQQ